MKIVTFFAIFSMFFVFTANAEDTGTLTCTLSTKWIRTGLMDRLINGDATFTGYPFCIKIQGRDVNMMMIGQRKIYLGINSVGSDRHRTYLQILELDESSQDKVILAEVPLQKDSSNNIETTKYSSRMSVECFPSETPCKF